MNTQQEKPEGLAAAMVRLIGRAAQGLVNTPDMFCPRCQVTRRFRLGAETRTTNESIYVCCSCGLKMS